MDIDKGLIIDFGVGGGGGCYKTGGWGASQVLTLKEGEGGMNSLSNPGGGAQLR